MASRRIVSPLGSYEIAYILEGDQAAPKVLFLHGWGAKKETMRASFGRSFGSCRSLFLDLPGFGGSSNDRVLSSDDYAEIVRAALLALEFAPDAIVAHSFGGKIAALLDPPLLVLLSSAGIPKQKSLSVRIKIALAKRFKSVAPATVRGKLRTSDADGLNEVMYETLKRVVDEDFSNAFAARTKPTLIFWGKSDRAMPLYCGETIHSLIIGSHFFPLEGDHFFFAQHTALAK